MKYIHPKLGREATQEVYEGKEGYRLNIKNDNGEVCTLASRGNSKVQILEKPELDALGFKLVEEIPERIENIVGDMISKDAFGYDTTKSLIIKSILKHMPKQEKIAPDEVDRRYQDKTNEGQSVRIIELSRMKNFLNVKGLLQ